MKQPSAGGLLSRLLLRSENCESADSTGIGPPWQWLVFFIGAAIVISHRPDAITYPQFFGEDGAIWYPEAYMSGWFAALFHPRNGYFQTLPRLAAAVALLFPLRFAPLVENLIGITVQVLPVNFLLSERCRNWGPLAARMLLAFLYLALPNTRELTAAPEEGQWHLALLACMIVLSCLPRTWTARALDIVAVLLSALSGPFAVILLPISLVFWYFRRSHWRLLIAGTVAIGAVMQVISIVTSAAATRSHAILGATPSLFIRMLGGQVFLGAMLGESGFQVRRPLEILTVAALLGIAVLLYCLVKARLEWKLLVAFCLLVFVASLKNPMVSMTVPQWQVLKDSSGIRYWFFPMIGFIWALAWCATLSASNTFRFAGISGLLLTFIGIVHEWKNPAFTNFHFAQYADQFERAPWGAMLNIPIFPDGWTMKLVKKSPGCHGLLLGSVDQPQSGGQVSGVLTIDGWVLADEPVRRVSIYVDRKPVEITTPNFPRPDVDSLYPQSPDKNKGWTAQIDFSRITPGPHEIELRALEAGGCEEDFAIIPVSRAK